MIRGLERTVRSRQFEGRFGRMFRTLPSATFGEEDLRKLAGRMVAAAEEEQTPEQEADDEENAGPDRKDPAISAGYTYLGQFIDHDLTFDPASSLQKQNDPDALEDFRTPRFDLDCIYGRGPDDQPYLYQDDGVRMLLGRRLTGNPDDQRARRPAQRAHRSGRGAPRPDRRSAQRRERHRVATAGHLSPFP